MDGGTPSAHHSLLLQWWALHAVCITCTAPSVAELGACTWGRWLYGTVSLVGLLLACVFSRRRSALSPSSYHVPLTTFAAHFPGPISCTRWQRLPSGLPAAMSCSSPIRSPWLPRLYVSFCISYGCEIAVAPSSLQHHQPCIYIDRQVDVQPQQRWRSTSSNRSCRHTPWLRSSRGHLTSVYVYRHNHIHTYM